MWEKRVVCGLDPIEVNARSTSYTTVLSRSRSLSACIAFCSGRDNATGVGEGGEEGCVKGEERECACECVCVRDR